jgi:hypothetical protein
MDAVIFQKMRVCRDRASGVDFDNLHIIARRFGDMRQGAAPDPAKAVDPDCDSHDAIPLKAVVLGAL